MKVLDRIFNLLKFLAVVVGILLVMIILFDFLVEKIVHFKNEVKMPMIEKLSFEQAKEVLEDKNLRLKIESEIFSRKVSSGCVVAQYPSAGAMVREGKIIKLIVSKGGQSIEIADVINMPQRIAEITLKNNGAIIGQEEYIYSLNIEKGRVVKQDPKPKALAEKGSVVNLKISKGLPIDNMKLMPAIVDMQLEDAKIDLENIGVKYDVIYTIVDDKTKQNIVLDQKPESDVILNGKKKYKKVIIDVGEFVEKKDEDINSEIVAKT